MPVEVLVPITFDAVSRDALLLAAEFARTTGARLRLLHVWAAPFAEQDINGEIAQPGGANLFELARQECVEQMKAFIRSAGVDPDAANVAWTIHSGAPAKVILKTCVTEHCDWVVMGTHRRRGLSHWLLGSVAEEVLRYAPCPVLVVPSEACRAAVAA